MLKAIALLSLQFKKRFESVGRDITELKKTVQIQQSRPNSTHSALMEFPMSSLETFELLETNLKDEEFYCAITTKLSELRGKSSRHLTTNLVKFLLTDELAAQFSLTGRGVQKKEFGHSKTFAIIKGIVASKFPADMTTNVLRDAVSDHFSQAKGRIKKRLERTNQQVSEGTPAILFGEQ
uniref:DUF4806 domain-containing protein n=1 Tax=Cacopsylla melanoneura TaxID=428564 RepID=A0A8D8Z056_9HEMI